MTTSIIKNPADSLDESIELYLRVSRSKALSERTVQYYEERLRDFRRFVESVSPGLSPRKVTVQIVRQYLTESIERTSPATANHNRAVLFRMFRFLVSEDYLSKNPVEAVDKARESRKVIKTLSPEEVGRLIGACNLRAFVGVRDKALITLLYDTGLRISEAIDLREQDVNYTMQSILVRGKGDKERIVPYGMTTRRALDAYIARRGEVDTDLLFVNTFGGRLDRNDVAHALKRYADKEGVPLDRATPHKLRHSFAVQYLRNGGDVFSLQNILGHSTLEMTRRYVNLAQADIETAHRRYSPADISLPGSPAGRKRIK